MLMMIVCLVTNFLVRCIHNPDNMGENVQQ